jgi:hypothetical protein
MRNHLTPGCSGTTVLARFVPIVLVLFLPGCGGSSPKSAIVPPVALPSIVSLSPTSGVAGASVTIAGTHFGSTQGTSTVTFNGTAASVASWSAASIVAKVPSGAQTGNVVVTVGGTASNGVNFTVVQLTAGAIAASNFGFQCGPGDPADCEGSSTGSIVWPTEQAQPGMLRLHDAGTQWAVIDAVGGGSYNWTELDQWLDLIAAHQPVAVSQVFTWVPCWDAPICSSPPTAPAGTNAPPSDLTPSGSPAFNNFVTAFVTHCNSNQHCVKDLIHYYEMWNEWDLQFHWTGTMAQVYQMVKPAVTIIKQNDPNAIIMTPSTTPASDTGLGYQADFQAWLNYENANGRISEWIAWHDYLTASPTTTNTPEDQWTKFNANFLSIQASTPGWINTPWADTETNFNGAPPPGLNYTCPAAQFTAEDCTGRIVRWQLLHDSNGAVGVFWYKWNETIGANQQYETAYYYMMQYLVGGTFSAPCSFTAGGGSSTWTCDFTEADGTSALWIWTPNESGTTYTVPSGYVDYRDLVGGTTSVTAGQQITIGTEPFMLEK